MMYKAAGVAVIAFSSLAILRGLQLFLRGSNSQSWPQVDGTIVRVAVKHAGTYSKEDTTRLTNEGSMELYLPEVRYRYAVKGRSFEGDTIVVGSFSPMQHDEALDIVRPYRDGMKVRVRHDPSDPAHAVLQAGIAWTSVVKWLAGGLLVLAIALFTRTEWWNAS